MSVDIWGSSGLSCSVKELPAMFAEKSLFKNDLEKFKEWKVDHVNNGDCHVNFEESSPAMEAEAAVDQLKNT